MKFIHIADLHFGKLFHGLSLLEDQKVWAEKCLTLAAEERPDAVLIAGDVYDRCAPADDAVKALSDFLTALAKLCPVMVVAGNHDSGAKLSFAAGLLRESGLHIAGDLNGGKLQCVTLEDKYGKTDVWLAPYCFPAAVAEALKDDSIRDYQTAMERLLAAQDIDLSRRNVIVSHQSVLANGISAVRGGSETMIGGVGEIDFSVFDGFEYAALGHIHSAQPVGRETVRYAGSPLCYHFSELRNPGKGPVVVELGEKGEPVRVSVREIRPRHPLREVRGTLEEILQGEEDRAGENEYVRAVVTDPPEGAHEQLKAFFQSRGSTLLEYEREGDVGARTLEGTAEELLRELSRIPHGDAVELTLLEEPEEGVCDRILAALGEQSAHLKSLCWEKEEGGRELRADAETALERATLAEPGERLRITVTGEELPADIFDRLRAVLKARGAGLNAFSWERQREGRERPIDELFFEFYQFRIGREPEETDRKVIRLVAEQLGRAQNGKELDELLSLLMEEEA